MLLEEARVTHGRPVLPIIPKEQRSAEMSRAEKDAWGYSTITSTLSAASSYLPLPGINSSSDLMSQIAAQNTGYWGRSLDSVVEEAAGRVPLLLEDLRRVILAESSTTEGVFRLTSNVSLVL